MSTKTIPAQIIKTCDGCGVTIDSQNSRQDGKLTLNAHALDMHGHACADATRKLDLCDSCLYKVGKAIDVELEAQLEAIGAGGVQALSAAPVDAQLLQFYGVSTDAELISAQARHIEKLQAKLSPTPSFAPQRVREG